MTKPTAPAARCGRAGRRLATGLLGLLAVLIAVTGVATAAGPSPSPSPLITPAGRDVGECLAAGEVWLVIRTDTGQLLRSECVGTPATGADALRAAEVPTTTTRGNYLCTLAGYPSRCPRTYRGQFWQYWHASGVGAAWEFSQKGAGDHIPRPGSIEGWCYNPDGVDRCQPPELAAADRPAPRVDLPPATGPDLDVTVWIAAGVVVAAVPLYLIVRRRGGRPHP